MPGRTDAPEIACSLTEEEFRARRSAAREALLPHVVEARKLEFGLKLTFPEIATLRSNVETFVSLERRCCSFLTFTVSPPVEGLIVTIEGPPEADATIKLFAAAIANDPLAM